jgi:FKBP-type peptidyl-prolyl cis-trans isomerase FklB
MKPLSLLTLVALVLCLFSCKEQSEAGEYDNWQARNDHYIDSIAQVCRLNADGQWVAFRSYDLGTSVKEDTDTRHYIYVHKESAGTGTYLPRNNDSIRVHYSGSLIPTETYAQGYNFGRSYYGYTLDETLDVPALMGVNGTVSGFKTAVMNMVEGDKWRIYVPYFLGYGAAEQTTTHIPAYSTLIFDVKLARIYRYKIDTDTKWW